MPSSPLLRSNINHSPGDNKDSSSYWRPSLGWSLSAPVSEFSARSSRCHFRWEALPGVSVRLRRASFTRRRVKIWESSQNDLFYPNLDSLLTTVLESRPNARQTTGVLRLQWAALSVGVWRQTPWGRSLAPPSGGALATSSLFFGSIWQRWTISGWEH